MGFNSGFKGLMLEFRICLCIREEESEGSFRSVFQDLQWKLSLGRSRLPVGIMLKLTVYGNEYIVNVDRVAQSV